MKSVSKTKAKEEIAKFFEAIKEKTPKEIHKIKKLAMKYNIPLKEKRKLFCKRCFKPYIQPKIRIKKGVKTLTCEYCNAVSRWSLK